MPTVDDVRARALRLPEAHEAPHHGFPSFRVGGKIFATLPDEEHLNVMLSPEEIREATQVAPEACEEQWWGKTLAAVRVSLSRVPDDVLDTLLTAGWRRRAPKALVKRFSEA